MKKLVAFAMILAIGLFTAAGCEKKKDDGKKGDKPAVEKKNDAKPADTKPADEKK